MPSADFCAAVRRPLDLLSRLSDTAQTSRGKTNSLPHPPPNLRSAFLVDMDFVVDRPLVRRSRLISGSCSSVHTFAPRFLQTPPRDDALALRYPFTSTRLGRGLSPPSCRPCPAHDPSTRPSEGLAQDDSRRRCLCDLAARTTNVSVQLTTVVAVQITKIPAVSARGGCQGLDALCSRLITKNAGSVTFQ